MKKLEMSTQTEHAVIAAIHRRRAAGARWDRWSAEEQIRVDELGRRGGDRRERSFALSTRQAAVHSIECEITSTLEGLKAGAEGVTVERLVAVIDELVAIVDSLPDSFPPRIGNTWSRAS